MRYPTLLACILGLLAAGSLQAQTEKDFKTHVSLNSLSYSDIAPIKQVTDGLKGKPIESGDHAFTHNQFEVGQRWRNWEIAAFWRYDYYLEFDKDTAQLVYLDKNRQDYQAGKDYKVYLQANHLRSRGLGLGYQYWITPDLKVRGRANYLSASEMQDGKLSGSLATAANTYSGDLQLDYGYSEDLLLDRPKESMQGRGWSLDLDLDWQINQRWAVWLHGRDIYSAIRWKNLSYTRANATTDRASYQPDGSISFRPAIQGREFYRDHTQRLPSRYSLGTHYQLSGPWSLESELFAYDEHLFPRAAVNWHLRHATLQASYDVTAEAFGIGLNSNYLRLLLRTDSLDYEKAKSLQLELAGRLEF